MASPRPDVPELLDVVVPDGGHVIAVSDLHLPPERTAVSARCCELLSRRLNAQTGPVTVVLVGDIVELLAFPGATAADILGAHEDLCAALRAVTERGGQVVYAIGNHDGDLAWDLKAATAVRDATGALLCLTADLVLPGNARIRVEHGHQLDPYNCFHDPTNPLDTPLGHHIVREVIPKIEWLGRDWLNGAHEMADPADFPSFLASRLVYRKLARHTWWLILLPILLLFALRLSVVVSVRQRYPDTQRWLHDFEILGYGALVDLALIALILAIVTRRAWVSISALALAGRGYSQNQGARQRAADLVADGYAGFISGHTHHPELRHFGDGFYANTGSCTSVVEAIDTVRGIPPVYMRTQQISWLELTTAGQPCAAALKSARVVLPGATRLERLVTSGRSPHASAPCQVAAWPQGGDWPPDKPRVRRRLGECRSHHTLLGRMPHSPTAGRGGRGSTGRDGGLLLHNVGVSAPVRRRGKYTSRVSIAPAVEISGLVKRYGQVTAVDGLTLTARAGAVTAILGPNGAGKTSIIEICEGYRRADDGTVRVLGCDPARDGGRLRPRVGVMLQSAGIPQAIPAADYLRLISRFHAHPLSPAELLETVGLTGVARTPYKRLSGGQQQRLSLAAAVIGRPELVFLDEPTAGMDPQARHATWDLVGALRSSGVSVILTTHYMEEAERLADDVVIIDHGRIVAAGSPAELTGSDGQLRFRAEPGLDTESLLGALPPGSAAKESPAGHYVIEIPGGVRPTLLAAVTAWCADRGILPSSLRIESRTLEDVFLELTGRELRE